MAYKADQTTTPPMSTATAKKPEHGMSGDEDCVPLSSLASPGEDELMNNPAVGDLVQYQVEGKLTRIEGENAYVKRDSINGKPLNIEAAKINDTPENPDAQFAQLQAEAGNQMV